MVDSSGIDNPRKSTSPSSVLPKGELRSFSPFWSTASILALAAGLHLVFSAVVAIRLHPFIASVAVCHLFRTV
jgi:hypothetical protein